MQLSSDDILKIARLSRLSLTDEEVTTYSEQLSAIFSYIDQLKEVPVEGVEETAQVTGLENVYRADVIVPFGEEKELVELAPHHDDGQITVKSVF